MKKKLLSLAAISALCMPVFAAFYMCVKNNDFVNKYDVDEIKEVLYERDTVSKKTHMRIRHKANDTLSFDVKEISEIYYEKIVDDTTSIVDINDTPLRFQTLSDSTVEVASIDKKYFVDEDGIVEEKEVEIPAVVQIDGVVYKVTGIGKGAFSTCSGLTGIKIPAGVIYIGENAFGNCKGLQNIEIPSTVEIIGEESFQYCSSLKNITLPSSVTRIDEWAFYGCSNLDIIIDNSKDNVRVETAAFDGVKSVTYTIENTNPADTTTVDSTINGLKYNILSESTAEVIGGCAETIIIPYAEEIEGNLYTITGVGQKAFQNCADLTSVELPENLTKIGLYAFAFCENLSSVVIPSTVTSISDSAFANCSSLASVVIPDSINKIAPYTFVGCSSLTSITIPSNVKTIGKMAFAECKNLDVIIENSKYDVRVDADAFKGCKSVTYTIIDSTIVELSETPLKFDIISDSTVSVVNDSSYMSIDSIVVPNKVLIDGVKYIVAKIEQSAFHNCSNLKSIELPNSLNQIGLYAFAFCENLSSVVIPSSVTSISDSAFANCSGLINVEIPESIAEIAPYTFVGCSSLTNVTIPSRVSEIGYYAFADCKNLDVVVDNSIDSIIVRNYAFDGVKSVKYTKEGDSSVLNEFDTPLNYKITSDSTAEIAVSEKNKIFGSIEIPAKVRIDGLVYVVTSIGNNAFEKCTVMTGVTIPSTVKSIGNSTFNFCSGLSSVKIAEGLESIGEEAFSDCTNVKSIEIPSTITSIGSMAFAFCKNLNVTVDKAEKDIEIGNNAFYEVKSVKYAE